MFKYNFQDALLGPNRRKLKLLPDNHFMIWDALAYAFLTYIVLYWAIGFFFDSSWASVIYRTTLVATFCLMYISSFWLLNTKWRDLMPWCMTLVGWAGHLDYWGAIAFILPAIAFMVVHPSTLRAVVQLTVITIVTSLIAWHQQMPLAYVLFVAPAIMIGGIGEHFFFSRVRAENQLLASQALLAQQATQLERERIARDLHDVLGHSLSAIAIKSELANKLIEADPLRAKTEMLEVEKTAREVLQQVRQAVVGYQSNGLQHEYNMSKATLQSANISVQGSADPVKLAGTQENALCLILREAITNIIRHANANSVRIRGYFEEDYYVMSICDDGIGLSQHSSGNGINNMKLRATHARGSFTIQTNKPQGCCINVKVPHDN